MFSYFEHYSQSLSNHYPQMSLQSLQNLSGQAFKDSNITSNCLSFSVCSSLFFSNLNYQKKKKKRETTGEHLTHPVPDFFSIECTQYFT